MSAPDLPRIALDELDSPLSDPLPLLTTYNVSEVLPGALSPLCWSTTGLRMDAEMRAMFARSGVPRRELARRPVVLNFSGHLFMDLNMLYLATDHTLLGTKEDISYAFAGRLLPIVEQARPAPLPRRLLNTLRHGARMLATPRRFERLARAAGALRIGPATDARGWYQAIDRALGETSIALRAHLETSQLAGTIQGLLLTALTGGERPAPEHHAAAAALLRKPGVPEGDARGSSLALADAIARVAAVIARDPGAPARFASQPVGEALAWLEEQAPPAVRAAFAEFLRDHGHRGFREVEIRERSWAEDPRPLVSALQAAVRSPEAAAAPSARVTEEVLSRLPPARGRLVRWLLPPTRRAIMLRELSKSLWVRYTREMRRAYLALGEHLVAEGRLPDVDLIFFFTHEELGQLVAHPDPTAVRRARHRRHLHPAKMALVFPTVSHGRPTPLTSGGDGGTEDVLKGTPVSRGVAEGLARVARSPEEAAGIQDGEILIVPHTDVGWAPYFTRAAGLATEIGGTLSHGAIVAREFGLPAVVNLAGATRRFRTGDRVRLDGDRGELRRL